MRKQNHKAKPAAPRERDDYTAVETFMRRANHDAKVMAVYLADWLERDLAAGLVAKSPTAAFVPHDNCGCYNQKNGKNGGLKRKHQRRDCDDD
jgi:hypothetical protein